MPSKTLIIKLGAMGDVIRTTALLRALNGDVYWITKKECIPLLPVDNNFLKQVIDVECAEESLRNISFDLVLCLDDDFEAARLATIVNKTTLIGSFLDSFGGLAYTESASKWFDMGLISKHNKEKADYLKQNNTKTYQEIIFTMVGKEFKGEEYVLNQESKSNSINKNNREKILVGIENRADDRWPTKRWNKYAQLGNILQMDGFEVRFFEQREAVHKYVNDISECDLIVTGDTLALHIALALKVKAVAIFTCTSPTEIYDYGRTNKVVSPLLAKAFYRREYIQEAVDAISLESVYKAVKTLIGMDVLIKANGL
jgi:heptosyltransferase-2